MAETNGEAFEATVGALVSGDVDAALVYIDPDVVFEPLRSATEGKFAGHDGIRRFVADTQETFDVFEPDFRDVPRSGSPSRYKDYGEAEVALAAASPRE